MANLSTRKDTNKLYFDFVFQGKRCRESSGLIDTSTNRRKLKPKLDRITLELATGTFRYALHFPSSRNRLKRAQDEAVQSATPPFEVFVAEWLEENKVNWRDSHRVNIESIINKHYLPAFAGCAVDSIDRPTILKFRAKLASLPGRNGRESLSNNRINKIMDPLRRIFEEASDRYGFPYPFERIKPLKIEKTDVEPFSLDEVNRLLVAVRPDYRTYFLVRFFTGMRTGEIDGLKWRYIDFNNRVIRVREAKVAGQETYTKTDASQRDIHMSAPVLKALQHHKQATGGLSDFVFCHQTGQPIDHNNVTKRVWYPLLKRLGMRKRRPYQTRHTAATLWLAAGESPEWIAKQMGHANTQMLFRVYSRFVPNLTRQDGSAFERMLAKNKGSADHA
ncbi:site-specific integrase [Neiella marina]|uniref:Site-specific integrase n=1 Tax=Neiella holothuriorum TaxID=2870530 RepID=A0ABS7ED74_9GAMM|nr:site-specific integrase [Neiella holothuriorum]MBW8190287.1 site-specific integrase [Neiella holothuriorum]